MPLYVECIFFNSVALLCYVVSLLHVDVASPEFQNCPGGQSFENIKYEGYYAWKLRTLKVKDNDQDSFIEQSVVIKQKGENTLLSAKPTECFVAFHDHFINRPDYRP